MEVSVGNKNCNLTKHNKQQIIATTKIKKCNSGGCLLQQGCNKCSDRSNDGKLPNIIESTKTNSPTPNEKQKQQTYFQSVIAFCTWKPTVLFKVRMFLLVLRKQIFIQIKNISFCVIRFSTGNSK